jgi:hypothetical protein
VDRLRRIDLAGREAVGKSRDESVDSCSSAHSSSCINSLIISDVNYESASADAHALHQIAA